jgi:hypothetical protein
MASLVLSSCGSSPEEYETMASSADTIDFREWCKQQKLLKCDAPTNTTIPLKQWQASLGMIRGLTDSTSQIKVSRNDLDLASVQNLLSSLGLGDSISLLRRIPWQTLEAGRGAIVLSPIAAGSGLDFNGLTLQASTNITASWDQTTLKISGLSLKTSQSGPLEVRAIVFDDPNAIAIVLANQTIAKIPLSFFADGSSTSVGEISPFLLLSRFADLGLDPAFNWRAKIKISVLGADLKATLEQLERLISAGQDQTLLPFFTSLRAQGKALTAGGTGDLVVNQSMQAPMSCSLRVQSVPVLGSVEVTIDFAQGFGLSKLTRLNKQRTKVDVYGVKTNYGDVRTIELEGQRLWIKIGSITIPLNGQNQNNGQLGNVRCAAKP